MLVCLWMLNVVGFKSDYHSTPPALAIVLHKKWRLSVDYNLTPPHLREEKNVRERERSPLRLRRWETWQGRSTRITIDDAGDFVGWGGLVSVHLSAILIWVITLQIEHSRSALLAREHNEVCRRSIKQCESRGIYLKNQRHWLAWPSFRPVCWNQIRERGLAGKVVRPQGCSPWRISPLLAPIADWLHLQMGKSKHFCMYLVPLWYCTCGRTAEGIDW